MELYGRLVSKADLTRRVGQMSQIAGARASELTSGLAKGVAAVDVKTGTGFAFTVLPGRGLDIAWASYKGAPIGYISKSGVVGAAHFVEKGAEGFLRNFFAGLLTTAGLSNIGPPVQVATRASACMAGSPTSPPRTSAFPRTGRATTT